jgi:manganese transport protein
LTTDTQPAGDKVQTRTQWAVQAAGPGIVFLLSSIGPSDLVSNSAAGANFGYALLWTLLVIAAARFVILEASARYVIATGESLLQGYRHAARWSSWVILGAIVMRRHLSNLYHVLLLGLAPGFLLGWDTGWSRTAFSLASAGLAFAVMYSGGYKTVERFSKPLAFLLGLTIFITMLWARPDPGEVLSGLAKPALPEDPGGEGLGLMLVILMLVGTGVGSLSNLKYSAFTFEKGWRDPSFLKKQRFDLFVSLAAAFLIAALLQVTAAAVLRPAGFTLKNAEELIPLFTAALGDAGRILMAVGLWTTVFTTYVGSNTGYSLLACDILSSMRKTGLSAAQRAKTFRGLLIFFCLSPIYVLWTSWKPVPLVIASSALMTLAVPLVTLMLLRITTDRDRMGRYVNTPLATAAMVLVTLASLAVTWQGAAALLKRF